MSKRNRAGDGRAEIEVIKNQIEKRLCVVRLPNGLPDRELRVLFSTFGALTECKFLADKGCAFIAYDTWAACHRALLKTDGQKPFPACSRPVVVSFAERFSTVGKGGGKEFAKGRSHNRLFMGALPPDATERTLHDLAAPFGIVESTHLLPLKPGKGRCGYVQLQVWGEAMDAVEALDNSSVCNHRISVMFAEPPPSSSFRLPMLMEPESKRKRLQQEDPRAEFDALVLDYVRALDSTASQEVLDILHHELSSLRGRVGRGNPWNGGLGGVHGSRLSQPRRSSAASNLPRGQASKPLDKDNTRLFVGGLPQECSDEELKALVEQLKFSHEVSTVGLLECRTLPGKGCGYLKFNSHQGAEECLEALDDRRVNGWAENLRCKWADPEKSRPQVLDTALLQLAETSSHGPSRPSSQGTDRTRLFVGQLSKSAHEDELQDVFQQYGRVVELRVLQDKGVAYVTYSSGREADAAASALHETVIQGVSRGVGGLNVRHAESR